MRPERTAIIAVQMSTLGGKSGGFDSHVLRRAEIKFRALLTCVLFRVDVLYS